MGKTIFRIITLTWLLLFSNFLEASSPISKTEYVFEAEPIDVIIPSTAKDRPILDLCIAGIKNNCPQIRRVIVVSSEKLTDQAEWFDEKLYPFSKEDLALNLCHGDAKKASAFLKEKRFVGWYLQQLLKLYAPFVIPGISSNVLVLDSDTVFLNPVDFLNKNQAAKFNPGTEYVRSYFGHAKKLLPGFEKIHSKYSGISHHMLLQRPVLEDLFKRVKEIHHKEFWQAFCLCVDKQYLKSQGASEFEIYFNFFLSKSSQSTIRKLRWKNVSSIHHLERYKKLNYHYVSCHDWMRKG